VDWEGRNWAKWGVVTGDEGPQRQGGGGGFGVWVGELGRKASRGKTSGPAFRRSPGGRETSWNLTVFVSGMGDIISDSRKKMKMLKLERRAS